MTHRHQRFTSIPTDILRSVVSISETGSFTKAAKTLGISQPAISAQMKRIEDTVGGALFTKSVNGSVATDLGKLVLIQARKILEANRQILLLRGTRDDYRGLRLGLTDLHARGALNACKSGQLHDVSIVVNYATEVLSGLINGYIDVGLFLLPLNFTIDPDIEILAETDVEMSWVRSPDFVINPGAPIPLITWGSHITHQLMVNMLERQGLIYRIVFNSPDHQARIEAAEQGLGLTALPRGLIPNSLMEARDYYLPPLPLARLYLCKRAGIEVDHERLIEVLKDAMFGDASSLHKLAG